MNSILEGLDKPFYLRQSGTVFAALYLADSLELLDAFPEETVDLIFADPPYFLSNGGITCHAGSMVSVNKGEWDQSRSFEKDLEFNRAWLSKCRRILKPNGAIWVSGTYHNIFTIGHLMTSLGYKILNDVIWEKPNPPPNLSCRYLTHSTETLLWAAKSKDSRHTFCYDIAKRENKNKQMKNVWKLNAPSGTERIWNHPTQKPEELLGRIIRLSSLESDLILDPFVGSGTTGAAAIRYGRSFIGIDNDPNYLTNAQNRINQIISQAKLFL